jgi:hypothetical protein
MHQTTANRLQERTLRNTSPLPLHTSTVQSSVSVRTLDTGQLNGIPLVLGNRLWLLVASVHHTVLGVKDVRTDGDFDIELVTATSLLLKEVPCGVQQGGEVLDARIALSSDTGGSDTNTDGLVPVGIGVGEEVRACRGEGYCNVLEARGLRKEVANVKVLLLGSAARRLESVLLKRNELEELESLLRGGDESSNSLGGNGGNVGDKNLLEVGGGLCHKDKVVIGNGLEVGVSENLQTAKVAEIETGAKDLGVATALGHLTNLVLEGNSQKLERGQTLESEHVVPVAITSVSKNSPRKSDGSDVLAVLQNVEDVSDGVETVDTIKPKLANVLGESGVVAEELCSATDRLVWVLENNRKMVNGGGVVEVSLHPDFSSLPPANVQFLKSKRQRPLVENMIYPSD